MKYLMDIDLLNIYEIIFEIIHLADNNCFIYVDITFFTVFSGMKF